METFFGRALSDWFNEYPLLEEVAAARGVCWFNPKKIPFCQHAKTIPIGKKDAEDAAARLERFRPYIKTVFPETAAAGGLIESPLAAAPAMQKALEAHYNMPLRGKFLVKLDSHLPISGSIKARGGIYEVLKHAEQLAVEHQILNYHDNYANLARKACRDFFSGFSIAVGSTGNLGLSIGIMGARLGFKVCVHMSADAKPWKKNLLREKNVTVIEYEDDYSQAVACGRQEAEADPYCHFVDDENSIDLFMGYAVAGERLSKQLKDMKITVDEAHPLFVYLPCGVGGGPGGIAFGLKLAFGDAVHCFFAEPTHSPAMLMGLYTGLHDKISVRDFGLDNITAADGLAVGRPSGFVGKVMGPVMDGAYTIDDNELYRLLAMMANTEGIYLEPSALAGFSGMAHVIKADSYLKQHGLADKMDDAIHLAWATGGNMVPPEEMKRYVEKGAELLDD